VLSLFSYKGYKISTRVSDVEAPAAVVSTDEGSRGGHEDFLIMDSFWTDYIIRTRQFHKGTVLKYKAPGSSGVKYPFGGSIEDLYSQTSDKWIRAYLEKHPGSSRFAVNLNYIFHEPVMVIQKLVVSPLFFFSMSARPKETYIKLLFSIFAIILAVKGLLLMRREPEFKKKSKRDIVLIFAVLFGFALLFFVTHAINRYSYPVLPYLYVWGGIVVLKIKPLNDFLTKKRIFEN
jgi:hypothetical protein